MTGGVFISYRRADSGGYAGRIYDRLASRLGRENVFFDVDTIPIGRDFVEVLSENIGKRLRPVFAIQYKILHNPNFQFSIFPAEAGSR